MPLPRLFAERVTAWIKSGSSSPVIVETAGGRFVTKLRGAGQGVPALVAEIIVAELAEGLGLSVPERVVIELPPHVASDDRNDELSDLLTRSAGENLGLRLLEGAKEISGQAALGLDDEFVARVLWLDGWVMNPDRTSRNPNILIWNGRPWLIDHGAALSFQYRWADVTEDSPREQTDYSGHWFESRASLLVPHDAALAAAWSRQALDRALERVPDSFLSITNPGETAARARAMYHSFLWKRLKAPRPFVPMDG